MPLTRDFKETVQARVKKSAHALSTPAFYGGRRGV